MKRIVTITLAATFAVALHAGKGNGSSALRPQNYTPVSTLQADEYMPNTMIIKVLPEYRNACTNERIAIPAVTDYFTMVGADVVKKKYPNHKAPAKAVNEYGKPLVDLSLIYEVHYTSPLDLDKAIGKLYNMGFFEFVEPHFIPKTCYMPNDPQATQASSYYLYIINAAGSGTTGWDISTGSSAEVVGITDTGISLTHADLVNKIAYNTADPIDGSDNDGDGYIDNYRGWDVAMNDNDPTYQGSSHGVHVSGCAAAETNNSVGVSGSGHATRVLPVKIADATGALIASYDGIVYAADHGCSVINCSWGGTGGGSYGQSIIDYAMNNMDALVVAAAGNNGIDEAFYPAAYPNVLSVAATNSTDVHAGFTNYNYTVDVCAPGDNILSTFSNTLYLSQSGTSMASPVCAGVAAIVRNYFPSYNAYQVGERVKWTTDNIYSISGNNSPTFTDKLGTGRIDLHQALTATNVKSVIYQDISYTDNNDLTFVANDTVRITGDFTNYLDPTVNLTATLSVVSGGTYVTLLDGSTTVGALATLGSANHPADPFSIRILPTAPINQVIGLKLTLTDGSYTHDQYFSLTVNVDYINITVNDVWTTITSKGLIGYNMDQQQQGLGFDYQNNGTLMYEASFMVGTSTTKVSDMARGTAAPDVDFSSVYTVRSIPNVVSDFDLDGKFRDNVSPSPLPVTVRHKAYAWSTAPHRKYVIVQYTIANTGGTSLSNMYAGIFADWDIDATTYGQNKADYDAANKMGYVWYTAAGGKYCGIKLLTNSAPAVHYAIDNTNGGSGGVNMYDGWDTQEKYTTLSTNRQQAGLVGQGNDVCDVMSSGPFTVPAGDSVTVAFALIAGDDLIDLQNSAVDAQNMYDTNGPLGVTSHYADNATQFNAFPNPTSGATDIRYMIAEAGYSEIRIVDASGRLVSTLAAGTKQPGEYYARLDAEGLAEGIYFLQLVTGEQIITRKLVVSH